MGVAIQLSYLVLLVALYPALRYRTYLKVGYFECQYCIVSTVSLETYRYYVGYLFARIGIGYLEAVWLRTIALYPNP